MIKDLLLKIVLIASLSVIITSSCNKKQEHFDIKQLTNSNAEVTGPYFTQDNEGNPVLCWAERSTSDSLYRLKYARYQPGTNSFDTAVTVTVSAGMNTSEECMGKVAFKADGTVIAVFGKRFEHEKNPFAGAIFYTRSTDQGQHWQNPRFLHSDTSHTYGRSFFDLATLKNGEIGAVWLDGRYAKEIKGSALFFSSTGKGGGFNVEKCVTKGTCECCRTAMITDDAGNIHIAYRSISFPDGVMGKQVRDMAYVFSKDGGNNFSKPEIISKDNWQIEGCPHSGPALSAADVSSVKAVWFTAGGDPGVYYTEGNTTAGFRKRTLLSAKGRHPQMISSTDGKLAVVYEVPEQSEQTGHQGNDHSGGGMHHQSAGNSQIAMLLTEPGRENKELSILNKIQVNHHAVVTKVNKGFLVAWVGEAKGKGRIFYSLIRP